MIAPMATLKDSQTGRTVALPTRSVIGRDASSDLVVDGARVSRAHARIHWQLSGWVVRDLGSRNGTFLNGTRIESGVDRLLGVQDRLRFGDAGSDWVLVDRTAPPISALNLNTRRRTMGRGEGMTLPGGAEVVQTEPGKYALSMGPLSAEAFDGQIVTLAGVPWRLELPGSAAPTVGDPKGLPLDELGLTFQVSRDEERVTVTLRHGDRTQLVPERASHYVLVLLARARLADAEAGHPAVECGWRDRQELYRDLGMDRESFNKAVSRLRKQFEELGVRRARDLIESGGDSRRIGVADLVVR